MKCAGSTDACLCQSPAHIVHSWPLIHVIWNRGADSSQKAPSTVRKESYPLLAIRRHGLKIAPLWKNTLSPPSKCISYSVCAPQICLSFISPQDYDYSNFKIVPKQPRWCFHLIPKAETSLFTVSCSGLQKCFQMQSLSNVQHFLWTVFFF